MVRTTVHIVAVLVYYYIDLKNELKKIIRERLRERAHTNTINRKALWCILNERPLPTLLAKKVIKRTQLRARLEHVL